MILQLQQFSIQKIKIKIDEWLANTTISHAYVSHWINLNDTEIYIWIASL